MWKAYVFLLMLLKKMWKLVHAIKKICVSHMHGKGHMSFY
jgi:hypothetical protein